MLALFLSHGQPENRMPLAANSWQKHKNKFNWGVRYAVCVAVGMSTKRNFWFQWLYAHTSIIQSLLCSEHDIYWLLICHTLSKLAVILCV